MKKLNNWSRIFLLPVLFAWFSATLFVDIIAVPTVFKNVTKVEEAGRVGMGVFTAFNRIELIYSLVVIMGSIAIYKRFKKSIYLILSLILFIWALSYNAYFTPQIKFFTMMIHSTPASDPMLVVYQTEHSFYHHLYRYLDTVKLLMLLSMIILCVRVKLSEEK